MVLEPVAAHSEPRRHLSPDRALLKQANCSKELNLLQMLPLCGQNKITPDQGTVRVTSMLAKHTALE